MYEIYSTTAGHYALYNTTDREWTGVRVSLQSLLTRPMFFTYPKPTALHNLKTVWTLIVAIDYIPTYKELITNYPEVLL